MVVIVVAISCFAIVVAITISTVNRRFIICAVAIQSPPTTLRTIGGRSMSTQPAALARPRPFVFFLYCRKYLLPSGCLLSGFCLLTFFHETRMHRRVYFPAWLIKHIGELSALRSLWGLQNKEIITFIRSSFASDKLSGKWVILLV